VADRVEDVVVIVRVGVGDCVPVVVVLVVNVRDEAEDVEVMISLYSVPAPPAVATQ